TPGPGTLHPRDPTSTADQANTNSTIALTRIHGALGPVTVNVSANPGPPGPGTAQPGIDYTFDAGTYGHPAWTNRWNYLRGTWELADAVTGDNLTTKIHILGN